MTQLEEVQMTPEEAMERLAAGGYVLCNDVPPATEFGCDIMTWNVGDKFKGLKMIPAGLHLLIVGTGHGSKVGEFVRVEPGRVIVRRFDPALEDLAVGEGYRNDQVERYTAAVLNHELDSNLGIYPAALQPKWAALTDLVTDAVLQRCGVACGTRIVAGDPDAVLDHARSAATATATTSSSSATAAPPQPVVPHFEGLARVATFTPLWPDRGAVGRARRRVTGMSPAEVTAFNLDASARLQTVLATGCGGDWQLLIGEFQLAFVLFTSVHSMVAFNQWRDVILLCGSCDDAVASNAPLFSRLLRTLRAHLEHVPREFFEDEVAVDNFLQPLLARLLSNIRGHVTSAAVAAADEVHEAAVAGADAPPGSAAAHLAEMKALAKDASVLRKFLERQYHMDLTAEYQEEDEAPVVVQVTENTITHASVVATAQMTERTQMFAVSEMDVCDGEAAVGARTGAGAGEDAVAGEDGQADGAGAPSAAGTWCVITDEDHPTLEAPAAAERMGWMIST